MKKRIFAWILLIGFILLTLNLMTWRWQFTFTLWIYIIVVISFMFYSLTQNRKVDEDIFEFELGYDDKKVKIYLPEKNILDVVRQNDFEAEADYKKIVAEAIDNPIGSPRLEEIFNKGEKIVIITSDITRPMPSYKVLPILVEKLEAIGIERKDLKIVFALGSHRKQTEAEKIKLVGQEIFDTIECVDSDMYDCVNFGTTKNGTPVDITRAVADCDKIIALGNIEYHYFAGYSGGAKAIMPGISSRDAIQANHSRMTDSRAFASNVDDNPVRLDIEEAARMFKLNFIVNVVLDEGKNIVGAVAGDFVKAHREGCKLLDKLYSVEIPEKADIVITTPGGQPKDLNLYQSQKALDNAKGAVKDGGIIILLASCKEGLGEGVFERWYKEASCSKDLIERVEKNFELGGHKAAAIAMVQEKAKVFLVSDLDKEFVESIFLTPFDNISDAINEAARQQGKDAKVLIMPFGGSTLPYIRKG